MTPGNKWASRIISGSFLSMISRFCVVLSQLPPVWRKKLFPCWTTDTLSGAYSPMIDRFSDVSTNVVWLKLVVLVKLEVVCNAFTKLIGLKLLHTSSSGPPHNFFLGYFKFHWRKPIGYSHVTHSLCPSERLSHVALMFPMHDLFPCKWKHTTGFKGGLLYTAI